MTQRPFIETHPVGTAFQGWLRDHLDRDEPHDRKDLSLWMGKSVSLINKWCAKGSRHIPLPTRIDVQMHEIATLLAPNEVLQASLRVGVIPEGLAQFCQFHPSEVLDALNGVIRKHYSERAVKQAEVWRTLDTKRRKEFLDEYAGLVELPGVGELVQPSSPPPPTEEPEEPETPEADRGQ